MAELQVRANVRFRHELAADFRDLNQLLSRLTAAAYRTYRTELRDVQEARRGRERKVAEQEAKRWEVDQRLLWSESDADEPDAFDKEFGAIRDRMLRVLDKHKV